MQLSQPYIQYLNKLQRTNKSLSTLQQLSDGIYLHEIMSSLKQFESQYPYQIITEPHTFIQSIKNIKSLLKAIQQFWTTNIKIQLTFQIDSFKIAKDQSTPEIQKLISLLLKTLLHSTKKEFFIEKILQTTQQTQQFFMDFVKEQASMINPSPKIQKSIKNHNQTLYDKLLQLEHQNDYLLRVMEQMALQVRQSSQKEKYFQEKLEQRQAQIRRLNWQIDELNQTKLTKYHHESVLIKEQRKINEQILEKIKEVEERQKLLSKQLQITKLQLKARNQSFNQLLTIESQLLYETNEKESLKQTKLFLENALQQALQQTKALQSQLNHQKNQNSIKQKQIAKLQTSFKTLQQQNLIKQQLIEQLENNIKYLLQTKQRSQVQLEVRNSIKDECKQILQKQYDKTSQSIIVRLKRQVQALRMELQSTVSIVEKHQKEIERLKLYKEQNMKLVQMISHMQKYRGQQNEVLVHCLYKMRMKMLGIELKCNGTVENKPLSQANRKY